MINIDKLDISKINKDGVYFDIDGPNIFRLSDQDIIAIREKYGNDIAPRREIKRVGVNNKYKLNRSNKKNTISNIDKFKRALMNPKVKLAALGIGVGVITASILGVNPKRVEAPTVDRHIVYSDLDASSIPTIDYEDIVNNVLPQETTSSTTVVEEINNSTNNNIPNVIEVEKDISIIRQETINKYCAIYGLNYDIVYNKIVELTDNFSSEDFLNGNIPRVRCKGHNISGANEELLFMLACRHMSQIPGDFGLRSKDLRSNPVSYEDNKTYEECINCYAHVISEDNNLRNTAYGIYNAETGGDSDLLIYSNNYGGLRNGDSGFASFSNKDEGAIEFLLTIQYNYFIKGMDTPEKMQEVYAPSYENDGDWWISTVNDFKNRANEYYNDKNLER